MMKRFVRLMLFVICMGFLLPASAQETCCEYPRKIQSPEKIARRVTAEIHKELNLSAEQYEKIYKLNLKEQKELLKAKQTIRDQRSMELPPREMRPHPGVDRPPMMRSNKFDKKEFESASEETKLEIEKIKLAEKREKKLKKILTPKQYEQWITAKEK